MVEFFYYYFCVLVLFNILKFVSRPQWKLLEFPAIVLSIKVLIIIFVIIIIIVVIIIIIIIMILFKKMTASLFCRQL